MSDKKIATQAALIRQMLGTCHASIVTSTLLAAVLAYVQRDVIAPGVIVAWLTLVVLVALVRAMMAVVCKRSALDESAATCAQLNRFRLGVLAAGIVWGSAGIVMFPANDPYHQIFLIFMLAGLTAGGVISYAADLIGATGFSIAALLPAIVRLFAAGDRTSQAMGMASLLYLAFMIVSLRHMHRHIRENIELRLAASTREEAARAEEERYRLLLNHSPVGILHYDPDLVITYCNQRFADILHAPLERLIGLDMKTLRDQVVLPALKQALQGELGYYEGPYTSTLSEVHKWVTMTCAPSRNGSGKIVGGVGIVQDVTALRESHQRMYSLLNSMAEGAYGVDTDGNCTFVNRAFLRILGYDHEDEVIGKHIHELIHHSHPDGSHYPASECRMYSAYRNNQEIHAIDEVFWTRDGKPISVEYWSQPLLEKGVMQGAIATFVDISERKQMLAELRESEERFRQMFERHSAVMLLIEPGSGMIVDANPAAARFYGYPLENLRGKLLSSINTLSETEIAREMQHAIDDHRDYFVFDHRLANGDIRTVEVHSSSVHYRTAPLLFSIIHDITERKLAEAQIRNLAFYDALTQLPNRRLLNDRLGITAAASMRSGRYAAVMFLDMDNFKPLNDMYGHAVGDLLLVEVANRLKSCVRQMDTVARFGGDEFVIVLNELDTGKTQSVAQARSVAEKICRVVSEPYTIKFQTDKEPEKTVTHHCTTSLGALVFTGNKATPDDLIKWADKAMYLAKEAGGDSIRFVDSEA
ncbi:hypothetical protein MIZ01_1072 [Sideroxyarcus emersonii]|uniref:Diguanylate cyclase n=1 Tax=Sideroxyarcus emersonii TaxID=2764705 RepID=A0AAN1X9I4_9PROT|nr:PAS domain S-box protein [Sideroxyarcus emersonii]BCK87300.1 hypothetical protein MIZ01_1072 [Sideroxyarcus emersonii]